MTVKKHENDFIHIQKKTPLEVLGLVILGYIWAAFSKVVFTFITPEYTKQISMYLTVPFIIGLAITILIYPLLVLLWSLGVLEENDK